MQQPKQPRKTLVQQHQEQQEERRRRRRENAEAVAGSNRKVKQPAKKRANAKAVPVAVKQTAHTQPSREPPSNDMFMETSATAEASKASASALDC